MHSHFHLAHRPGKLNGLLEEVRPLRVFDAWQVFFLESSNDKNKKKRASVLVFLQT